MTKVRWEEAPGSQDPLRLFQLGLDGSASPCERAASHCSALNVLRLKKSDVLRVKTSYVSPSASSEVLRLASYYALRYFEERFAGAVRSSNGRLPI